MMSLALDPDLGRTKSDGRGHTRWRSGKERGSGLDECMLYSMARGAYVAVSILNDK